MAKHMQMINNYIYLYHTDTFIVLPQYADNISDSMQVGYNPTTVLSRTAPIYSYGHSGPRSIAFQFTLHRDLMTDINCKVSNATLAVGEDYIDTLIKQVQAAALPSYDSAKKLVDPPVVAVRLGTDIFIKGVVTGGVTISYQPPIIPGINSNGKVDKTQYRYACVSVSFTVSEIEPYDAELVMQSGGFRGISTDLHGKEQRIFKS